MHITTYLAQLTSKSWDTPISKEAAPSEGTRCKPLKTAGGVDQGPWIVTVAAACLDVQLIWIGPDGISRAGGEDGRAFSRATP